MPKKKPVTTTTKAKKLLPAEKRFLQELLKDPSNMTEAAVRAKCGNTRRQAAAAAARMMGKVVVQQEWQRMQRAFSLQCEVKANDVVRELQVTAFSDIRDYVDWGPDGVSIKDPDDLPAAEMTRCIKSIRQTTTPGRTVVTENVLKDGTVQTKTVHHHDRVHLTIAMHDKLVALHKIGLHLGMWDNGGRAGGDHPPPLSEPLTEAEEFAALERYAELVDKRKHATKRLGYDRDGEPINVRR